MRTFINELIRIEINDDKHTFNGFDSSEAYTQYLLNLYQTADMSAISDERYASIVKNQLNEFILSLDAYLPIYQQTVDNLAHDATYNSNLKREVEWYQMLLDIRGIKEYYYREFLKMLSLNSEYQEVVKQEHIEQNIVITDNLIKGVEAIGNVLGCGKTKAQAILNTNFLKTYEVGYYLGRRPVLELDKWNKLPAEIKSKISSNKK